MSSTSKLSINSTLTLPHSKIQIPQLGFGVYLSSPDVCTKSCLEALKAGYRHIDTAQYYDNESEVGKAILESGIPREQIFVTTKILFARGSVESSLEGLRESVAKIDPGEEGEGGRKGYVDLVLIHSPNFGGEKTREMWEALEGLKGEGAARSIGVSNFGRAQIEEVGVYAREVVEVNQIELHPWCQQREIVEYCQQNGIIVEAYSPIVRNQKADDATLVDVAKKYGKSTAQVLIRYCLQKGWVPLPKSDTPERIRANADVFDFELEKVDMERLDGLDEGSQGAIVQAVKN
ncbi:hypothetical protein FKW77_004047 [Venturia effusa]|uniref:NADP-dependent oxidoreductase domain-containing protein n=1 Tax=Venturia effusa TaxID=50376 RepID=A0A517L327_9PEZI|nr:hypothetical protein FKW77_004047 [Venturia effusa]